MKKLKQIFLLLLLSFVARAQAPELLLQKGHTDDITIICFAPKGNFFASGSNDKTIRLTDVSSGITFKTFTGHTEKILNIVFTSDGKKMISGSKDEVIVWDLENEKKLYVFTEGLNEPGTLFNVSPQSNELIFQAHKNNSLQRYDLLTGKKTKELESVPYGDLHYFSYTPDNKYLLAIGRAGVHVLDRATDAEVFILGTQNIPKCFYITGDSRYYYCANDYLNWQKWDLKTGKLEETRPGRKNINDAIGDKHFAVVNSGHSMLAVEDYKSVSFYDLWSGKLLQTIKFTERELKDKLTYNAAAFSPQGNVLVVSNSVSKYSDGDKRPKVSFIDTRSGRTIFETGGFISSVNSICIAPDDKCLAITGVDQETRVWEMDKTGGHMVSLKGEADDATNIFWSPDSRVVVATGNSNYITDLNTGDGRPMNEHFTFRTEANYNPGEQTCISPDFKLEAASQRILNYENGSSVCVADPTKDIYTRGTAEEGSGGNLMQKKTFAPDNRTLLLISEDKLISVNILDVLDCKKTGVISYDCGAYYRNNDDLKYCVTNKYITIGVNSVRVSDYKKQEKVLEIPARGARKTDPIVRAVAVNQSENLLAIAYEDTTIDVYSIPSGKKLQTLRGHDLPVTSLQFKNKSDILISASPDSKIIFWNPQTAEHLGTMVAVDSTDFIITTPENYYFATKGALKKVAFRKGKKVFPFEQFDLKFNRPDIVFKKLELASVSQIKMYNLAYKKRLQKAGFTEEMLSNEFYLPELEVKNKYDIPILKYEDTLSFTVFAKDPKYGLKRINVYVNDVAAFGVTGIQLNDKPKEKLQKISLKLSNKVNRVQVSVTNEKGIESMREVFEVNCQKADSKPDLYMLLVGVSEFKQDKHNLKYAAKDAQDLSKAFANNPAFGKINIKQVINSQASKENILKEAALFSGAKEDDVVMLYISSHGLLDEKLDYFIATNDVDFNAPSARGLPYQELEAIMDKSPSRNRLVLIDACHSGEVDKEETQVTQNNPVSSNANVIVATKAGVFGAAPKAGLNNSFTYMQALFDDVSKGIGATIISAAGGMEFALESSDWNNGVFTYSILHGLKNNAADFDNNGVIKVSELKEFVTKKVIELTEGKQVPNSRKMNLSNDFIIR